MKLKRMLSAVTCLAVASSFALSAVACDKGDGPQPDATPTNTDVYEIPQDYARTYYEVFVRSFADGNGDGIGDIRGLIENLDYLNDGDDSTTEDLGINGIWMMPINSSPSYHKYDVTDYYDIDDEYGTLEDFDELVEECDKRGIWLQMDLVLNHTSSQHPWFLKALEDAKNGYEPEDSEAMQRYVFVHEKDKPGTGTYRKVTGTADMYYLGNFSHDMPDLNLANESVREEIKKIVDFWLERGIKSFRLDAVPWACADAVIYTEENGEFWSWFNDYCDEKGAQVAAAQGWANDGIGRYSYNVGEVWASGEVVNAYFDTGMSNFNYSYSGGSSYGSFAQVASSQSQRVVAANLVNNMANTQADVLARDEHAILSNFLTNHDNDRLAAMFLTDAKLKSAASLYMLMPGSCYIYYGEELGAMGTGSDPNRRLPFNWGDERGDLEEPTGADYESAQKYGSWKDQTETYDSILTYYRNTIKLRNRFPEIAHGVMTAYAVDGAGALVLGDTIRDGLNGASIANINALNRTIAAYTITWKDRTVAIVHNFGEQATLDVSAFADYALVGTLTAGGGTVTLSNGSLVLPSNSVAVLKAQ